MLNNPVSITDADGNCPICVAIAIAVIVGGTYNTFATLEKHPDASLGQLSLSFLAGGIGAGVGVLTGPWGVFTAPIVGGGLNIGADHLRG